MKLRKTTALLIAIFMISTFAMVMPVSAVEYSYCTSIEVDESGLYLEVTVTDDGDLVTWTFDFPVEDFTGNGNLNVGLIIALDGEGEGPAYQIHNNDGATPEFPVGTWLMSPWIEGSGWFGWLSGSVNTPVSDLDWVEASGNRNVPHEDGILTVRIKRSELGNEFHWAASPTVGSGFWAPAYDVTMQIPTDFGWTTPIVDMDVLNYEYALLIMPDTIAPVVTLDSPTEGSLVSGTVEIYGTIIEEIELSHYNIAIYPGDADFMDFSKRLEQETVSVSLEFVDEPIYQWDTTKYDDGEYLIRLAARDAADNRDLSKDPYEGGVDSQHVIRVTVDNVRTKAEVLDDNGVPGKGIDDAPGLDKPIPNDNFAKHENFGKGPGPHNGNGPGHNDGPQNVKGGK